MIDEKPVLRYFVIYVKTENSEYNYHFERENMPSIKLIEKTLGTDDFVIANIMELSKDDYDSLLDESESES